MTEDKTSPIADPLFDEAIAIAKGMARQCGLNLLMPTFVLAGLIKALEGKGERYPELSAKIDAIKVAVSAAGLTIPDGNAQAAAGKMPLSDTLRKAIAAKGVTLETFVEALLGFVGAATSIKSPAYAEILAHAAAVAASKASPVITPEFFSAAAHIAFVHGKFSENPALSGLLIANHQAFAALIKEYDLDVAIEPSENQSLLPLSDDILAAMRAEGTQSERLFAAINLGLKSGQRFLSQSVLAYHEAGHAVVSAILRPSLPVTQITIVSAGDADGKTVYDASSPFWDQSQTRETLGANLATLLAGRAAQLIKFGDGQIDIGASADIERATVEAWKGIALFGLDLEIGPINLETLGKLQGQSSGWIFDLAQQQIHRTLKEAADRAESLLRANWAQVEAIVADLLQKKVMFETDFAESFVEKGLWQFPNVRKARSRPIKRQVVLARTPGVLQTHEGPVRYDAGDALLVEDNGRTWPVPHAYFARFYAPTDGVPAGADGAYVKKSQDVLALELAENKRLDLSRGRGILAGKPGDWLVDHGDGELSIVSRDQFPALYDLVQDDG